MAQLASASGLGPEGPVFESQYPDLREVIRLDDLFFRIWPGLYAVPTGRAKKKLWLNVKSRLICIS